MALFGRQEFGFSEEYSFRTAPAQGSDASVSLLAIADLGFCEGDGALTWSGNYPNRIQVTPPGTDEAVRVEVRHALLPVLVFRCCLAKQAGLCHAAQYLAYQPRLLFGQLMKGLLQLQLPQRKYSEP